MSGELLDTIADAVDYGVPSFKVFMVYDFGVTDGVFYRVLQKAKEVGALIEVHAENNEIINTLTKEFLAEWKKRQTSVPSPGQKPPAHRCILSIWRTKAASRL